MVLLADESHLLWGDVCGYGWGKTSERLVAPVGNAKTRQTYFGALNAKSGELVLQPADKADSTGTIAFLNHLQAHYPNKQLWVIWDNASYHCSQLGKDYLQQINGQLPQEQWPLTLIGLARECTGNCVRGNWSPVIAPRDWRLFFKAAGPEGLTCRWSRRRSPKIMESWDSVKLQLAAGMVHFLAMFWVVR